MISSIETKACNFLNKCRVLQFIFLLSTKYVIGNLCLHELKFINLFVCLSRTIVFDDSRIEKQNWVGQACELVKYQINKTVV